MTIEIFWSDKSKSLEKCNQFKNFAQMMANRLIVGVFRYDRGKPVIAAKYLTRLKAELKTYQKTGNTEHLINIANYCLLETIAPEHPKSHFEYNSKSITRDVLGMRF